MAHGPTVTYRDAQATRHVPGGGLYGGYCMARVCRPGERDPDDAEQLDLLAA
jgi:hypothetical protein